MSDSDPQPPEALEFHALTPEQLAPLFPRLEIGDPIAVGGMGAVYKARQPELDRMVALKILPPELCGEAEYVERFRSEARAMAQLNHPNLVGVHDFGETNGYFYFIMEYVEGQNLAELLAAHGKFGPEFALPVMLHVCDGIAYAHGKGVVHLDLKPANIMLDNEGMVKILDFGLAKLLDPTTGSAQENMGTPEYAAPERFTTGAAIDHRADLFSMGVILYEMLSGQIPRSGTGLASQHSNADPSVDKIVDRCTQREAASRYQAASEIRGDLAKAEKKTEQALLKSPNAAKLLSGGGGPQVAAAAKKFRRRLRRKMLLRKVRTFAMFVIVLAVAAGVAWKMNLIPKEILDKLGLPSPPAKEEAEADADVATMPDELKELYGKLSDNLELRVDIPRREATEELGGKYRNALAKLKESASSDADLAAAIDAELERFNEDGSAPEEDSSYPNLAKLQGVLREELGKIEAEAETSRKTLLGQYDNALNRLHGELVGEGRDADAERVQVERERIAGQL